jgi:hypothetical protein
MAEKPLTIHDVIQGRGPRGLLTADEIHELVRAYWKDRDTCAGTMLAVEASYVEKSPKIVVLNNEYKRIRDAKQRATAALAKKADPRGPSTREQGNRPRSEEEVLDDAEG